MPTPPAALIHALISQHREALIADWHQRLRANELGVAADLRSEMDELLAVLAGWLAASGDPSQAARNADLDRVLAEASQLRAVRGQSPESSVRFVQALKDALLQLLAAQHPDHSAQREAPSQLVQQVMDRCVSTLVTQFVAARESVIRSQAQSLLDMSTPVITLWDSILLLPLVGVVDSVRAVQVAERLLEAIGRTEAEITLIDVTGVPVMDTSVARHLLRTVAAAEMLGSRVILTGISPNTAQTMVKLGIDMSSVPTRGTLKAGLALALQLTGRQLTAKAEG